MGRVSSPPDPATMMAALIDPVRLQVFAAMATTTGPGRREQFPPAPNTRSVAYLTPTGAANLTGVSVEDAYAAFRALQKAGLAIPASTNPNATGFGWIRTIWPRRPGRIRHHGPVVQPVSQSELLSRVRELRGRGLSAKQVARELGMKPAEVAPLVRLQS